MEAGQVVPDPTRQLGVSPPVADQSWQHPAGWQPPHLHDRFNPPATVVRVTAVIAIATDEQVAVLLHKPGHSEVDVRAEPTIQAHLVGAPPCAPLDVREVQEAEGHWLLDLVRVRPGQDDPGDVGLMELEIVGRVRIRRRPQHRLGEPTRRDRFGAQVGLHAGPVRKMGAEGPGSGPGAPLSACGPLLPELAEEAPNLADDPLRNLHRREMAAALEARSTARCCSSARPHRIGWVTSGGRTARRSAAGEALVRTPAAAGVERLVVELRRRARRRGQPVEADVGQQLVAVDAVLGQLAAGRSTP